MSNLADINNAASAIAAANTVIAAKAAALDAQLQAALSANPGSTTWPAPVDLFAGSFGGNCPMALSTQNVSDFNRDCVAFARGAGGHRDGAILVYGDSIVAAAPVNRIHPACVNYGSGGDTIRGFTNRWNLAARLGAIGVPAAALNNNIIRRAGAGVFALGLNDGCSELHVAIPGGVVAQLNFMWDQVSAGLTGPWVICGILPIDESAWSMYSGVNSAAATINAYRAAYVATHSNMRYVGVPAGWDPTPGVHTIDGMHPNKAGYDLWIPLITAALSSMGIS